MLALTRIRISNTNNRINNANFIVYDSDDDEDRDDDDKKL